MEYILLVDFGSTYTKVTLVDPKAQSIVCTAKSETTVSTDIMAGYYKAVKQLEQQLPDAPYNLVDCLVCSSAAGGLKMVASGLVKQLTAEAAKLACLGSGARMLDVFSQKLSKRNVVQIQQLNPDILLLAGGTDGGNEECILHNAYVLSKHIKAIPYVAAGNKTTTDELAQIFNNAGVCYKLTDNVMPELNQIHIEPARFAIREVFMEKIVEAKGLSKAQEQLAEDIIPTPMAVLRAAELLANGTDRRRGWGPLMIVDIGGATTDVHTACDGHPSRPGAVLKGLIEPYLKRTVEGDLGMRVSAESLMESVGLIELKELTGESYDYIEARCRLLTEQVDIVPWQERDICFDESLASAALKLAVERHAGHIESVYSPMGVLFYQNGKDLSKVRTMIGTGGVMVHSQQPENILKCGLLDDIKPDILKPVAPRFVMDASYMLSAAGLLSERYPELAFELMNKYLIEMEMSGNDTSK